MSEDGHRSKDAGDPEARERPHHAHHELVPGARNSIRAFVIPPNRNRMIPSTEIPRRLATTECASSWMRTEPKNSTATQTARAIAAGWESLGYVASNCRNRL